MLQKTAAKSFCNCQIKSIANLLFVICHRAYGLLPGSCAGYAAVRWAGSIQINTTDGGLRSQLLSV